MYIELTETLFEIVTLLNFYPRRDVDGPKLTAMYLGNFDSLYHTVLLKKVGNFLKSVNRLFCFPGRYEPIPYCSILDKPNLHRLPELVVHSIPIYRHCNFFSDSLFEAKHQRMKRNYHRNKNEDRNVWAVHADAIYEWKEKLARVYIKLDDPALCPEERQRLRRQRLQLLLGAEYSHHIHGNYSELELIADNVFQKLNTPSTKQELLSLIESHETYFELNKSNWEVHPMHTKPVEKLSPFFVQKMFGSYLL